MKTLNIKVLTSLNLTKYDFNIQIHHIIHENKLL